MRLEVGVVVGSAKDLIMPLFSFLLVVLVADKSAPADFRAEGIAHTFCFLIRFLPSLSEFAIRCVLGGSLDRF